MLSAILRHMNVRKTSLSLARDTCAPKANMYIEKRKRYTGKSPLLALLLFLWATDKLHFSLK